MSWLGILLHQRLLHQDLFLVLYLVVLRDGGVAVELQLVVAVLRLAWLVVGVLVGSRSWTSLSRRTRSRRSVGVVVG